MIVCVWSVGEIIFTWKNVSTRRETCLTATLFNTNIAWAGPGSSPRLRGTRSAGSGRRLTVWGMAWPLNKSTACRHVDLRESGSVQDKRPCRPPSLVTSPALANVLLHLSHAERRQNTRQTRCSRGRTRRCTDRLEHLHGAWTRNTVRRKTSTPLGIFPITRLEWYWHLGPNPYNRKCTSQTLTELESCTATILRASLRRVSTNMIRRLCLYYREGGSLPTSHVTLHVFGGLVSLRNILSWKRPKRL
jgi:hypothetical protein